LSKIPFIFRIFWHFYDQIDFWTAWRVKKIIKKEKPDLIITNNLKGISILTCFCLAKEKKHLHILHDVQLLYPSGLLYWGEENVLNSFLNKIYIKINKIIFKNVKNIISPSKWLLELHQEKGFFLNSHNKIIPNPLNLNNLANNYLPKEDSQKTKFLYVGLIEEHKGILFLLKTFRKILERSQDSVELNIIGDGSLLTKCKSDYSDLADIKFWGKLENNEVNEWMQKTDCLIVPSFCYENSPTVIYEAFANNLSVLASSIGGIPELMQFGHGILFEPKNEKDLVKKIRDFKNLKQKKDFSKEAKVQTLSKLSAEEYIKKLI
jgi:glycosyltransferase involved in cell wall biosynthesis